MKSLRMATKIIREFKPDVVVGVGGYASAPVLNRAARLRIPTVIQEQNSYAGVANRWLGKRATSICVAYDGMEKYFPKERIKFTGNPVREDLINLPEKVEAANYFGLEESRRTILVLGGSLGAGTINKGIAVNIDLWMEKDIQMLWQTGKNYYKTVIDQVREGYKGQLKIVDFIDRMDLAYAMADIIISRAGAGTISELCLVGKPCILIPSPNVAGDHQTSNALSLLEKEAALMVRDSEVHEKLAITSIELSRDIEQQKSLKNNISQLARPHAARDIVEEVMKLTNRNN
jgi:UDP-N-acetylglucosamine--N-acetylmuramyl-(pentapeptide) pyrophosphoryl-undecaprenol N-acetylglucosamine transferase